MHQVGKSLTIAIVEAALLVLLVVWIVVTAGCAQPPRIALPSGERVQAPADAGKPAEISRADTALDLPVPAGSVVESVPAPEAGAPPTTRVILAAASTLRSTSTATAAATGTIDTTIAVRRADNHARAPLLWAAIGAAALGVFASVVLRYPMGVPVGGLAGAAFFAAWKLDSLPGWFWAVGLAVGAVGVGIFIGYERGEEDSTKPL